MVAGMVLNVAKAAPLPEAKPNDVGNGFWSGWTISSPREMAAKRVSGAVVAIARDDKLVHYKGYGQLDSTKDTPIPLDVVFGTRVVR